MMGGHEYDLLCANERIDRAKELLNRIMPNFQGFNGFGLGFENPEFFWYIFIESRELIEPLRGEFSAAKIGMSLYPIISDVIRPQKPVRNAPNQNFIIQGGLSIGNITYDTNGTLGCVVKQHDRKYMISTSGVLGPPGSKIHDEISQPSPEDNNRRINIIGKLESSIRPNGISRNSVDVALAQIYGHVDCTSRIKDIGRPLGYMDPAIGMNVRKSGKVTSYTEGKIISTDVSFLIYRQPSLILMVDQFLVASSESEFCTYGDEGSFIMDGQNQVIGIIVQAYKGMALCCNGRDAMERLGITDPNCFDDIPVED
jgi:hypothetical protein